MKNCSRRNFILKTSVAGVGLGVGLTLTPSISRPLKSETTNSFPEETEPIIDIHQHTNYSGRTDDQLVTHQRAMGITTTILLPSGRKLNYGSTYYGLSDGLQAETTGNEACHEFARRYPKEFMAGANEVPDFPEAVQEIEKYLKLGAPIIGEQKFGIECDSPEMQRIYTLAQAYRVPVLMHWQYGMYNRGFERFHTMLDKFQKVNFIGHAQTWWANVDKDHKDQNVLYPKTKVTQGGLTDRYLADYPNMYGDVSAGSGLNSMLRDEDHARAFLGRHQDKLLYGSDCSDVVGHGPACQGAQTIETVRRLSPDKKVERKILYLNAKKLFKL
ncbi:MAG: amidohydrolase family protein [Cyclobacteriaceae bacterium]